ncbi:MAG: hypothetical protein AB2A00_00435 [Myxococcota bacterium]
MKLLHNGLTIELAADDARVPIIEALLFGRTLPPPIPLPEEKPAPPLVEIPDGMRRFWKRLDAVQRRELLLLAERPYAADEMEEALGLSQRKLMGKHSSINRLAHNHRVAAWIQARGRHRGNRRYALDPNVAKVVKALAASP